MNLENFPFLVIFDNPKRNLTDYKIYSEFLPISANFTKEFKIKLFYREDDDRIVFLKRIPLI